MTKSETYTVQVKYHMMPKNSWKDVWGATYETRKEAREELDWQRKEYSDEGETYRIKHEIKEWEYIR
tara:strand:+ start:27 stop:227 length:201 start_codon:yes stop_codon:yes gene_type:complete